MVKYILQRVVVGLLGGLMVFSVHGADYKIDTKGSHASIQFKIQHLGYSWLTGHFKQFTGEFSYDDKNPTAARVSIEIDPSSIDTNHAERDKHLKGKDFLDVKKFPVAIFSSTSFDEQADGKLIIRGNLTLHGITQEITLIGEHIGHGADPWGGYRRGFSATTTLTLKDFGINKDLGPASATMEMMLHVEGIRKHKRTRPKR